MTDPAALPAREAVRRIRRGDLSVEALVRSCLERIALRDDAVRAWAHVDADVALDEARRMDRAGPKGPLHGVCVGIKDIIDVRGMPTGFNSPIYPGYHPPSDAACVAMIRASGGIVLGKTVTTEFANRHPGPTRNPLDPARTPGGSSSGSAAAVADFQVPLAVGTQTGGSTIRPAAYCGIVGYKPSFGDMGRLGVKLQSSSTDTIGLCGRTLDDVVLLRSAILGEEDRPLPIPHVSSLRIALCRPPKWDRAESATRAALEEAARLLSACGASVSDLTLPEPLFSDFEAVQSTIVAFECTRNFAHEKHNHHTKLSDDFYQDRILRGDRLSLEDYIAAQRRAEAMRGWLDEAFDGFDAIATLAALGEAPQGLSNTGKSTFNLLWTMLHVPCVTISFGRGPAGMPLGLQLIGKWHGDARLLAVTAAVQEAIVGAP